MNTDRIKQIQQETAYPESLSVLKALLKVWNETEQEQLRQPLVSGSASDFERELYKLINEYVSAGLKKPDLVHKMEYVTQSCRVS